MAVQLSFKHLKDKDAKTPFDLLKPIDDLKQENNNILIVQYKDGKVGAFDSFVIENGKAYHKFPLEVSIKIEIIGEILGYLDFSVE